jgi:Skp family chaperone for outer membrane proteins
MRIWDIAPSFLCRKHLLAEHGELHALWSIILNNRKGFSKHPETLRWRGKLKALYNRHEELVKEMEKRGYQHSSALDKQLAKGKSSQDHLLQSRSEQKQILAKKSCCYSAVS